MNPSILPFLKCPACGAQPLNLHTFTPPQGEEIENGVLLCKPCAAWYPIEDGLLELLVGELAYHEDRERFAARFAAELARLEMQAAPAAEAAGSKDLQMQQQTHFDWYADNAQQSYSEYERTPFWLAADRLAFDPWRAEIQPGTWLMDVGCAQGRSTFKLMDLPIHVLGLDIAKRLVRQALDRYRAGNYAAQASFIVADANQLPLVNSVMDYVLIYGVLHHLPNPTNTCREVARILKPGGVYFGSENNQSVFRKIFDLLQRLRPLWYEEAGPEALISKEMYRKAFENTGVSMRTRTSVFLPPHLMNLMSEEGAYRWLKFFDRLGGALPLVRGNGGLIVIRGEKAQP